MSDYTNLNRMREAVGSTAPNSADERRAALAVAQLGADRGASWEDTVEVLSALGLLVRDSTGRIVAPSVHGRAGEAS